MQKILVFLLLVLSSLALAQIPVNPIDYMQNPPGLDWRVIKTEHFELIFPKEIETKAQEAAHLLESVYPHVMRSMEETPHRIPLVLQNQSVISNGFVTLAPRRSEFFMTPAVDPELSNTEWVRTLAIHELRHVAQFQKGRRGFSKYFYFFLGEAGQALGLAFTAPPWFYEGDAVGIETALTPGGRGRLPLFERDLRTLLVTGKEFSYDKAHLGSYRDYIPNHYIYGYFMTSRLRNEGGDLAVSRVYNESAERSWNPLAFYRTMDELSPEKDFEKFYRHTMKDLLQGWRLKLSKLSPTPYTVHNPKKDYGWTNYLYPQFSNSGDIVALKRGLSFISRFVVLKDGKEKNLFYPGELVQEYPYKLRNDRLAFAELELDPRWGYRNLARLKVYDLRKDDFILDLRSVRHRLPVLDERGEKILAVEWKEDQTQKIVVLDLKGKVLQSRAFREGVITSLDWVNADSAVLVVKNDRDEKRVVSFDLRNGTHTTLFGPTSANLGFVAVEEGKILVESPESGIDNIFLIEGTPQQIVSSTFGSYAPELRQGKLLYNEYTAEGMIIAQKTAAPFQPQNSSGTFLPVFEKFASSENFTLLKEDLGKKSSFESKDYSQTGNAINVHSWLILAPPLSNTLTLQAYSRDILNKFSLAGGYTYNLNERTHLGFVTATWSHLYPVFDLTASHGGRRQEIRFGGRKFEDKWEEGIFEAGVSVPWRQIRGRFLQDFSMRAFTRLIKVTNKIPKDRNQVNDGALLSPGAEVELNFLSRTALRDLFPRWGVAFNARAEEGQDITGNDESGVIRSVDTRFYLPGAFRHHSFYHQLAYEHQNDDFYQYESLVLYPRGTRMVYLDEFVKYSANYTLPFAYPDWNLSRYFYLRRLAMNVFYDNLNGRLQSLNYETSSAGWELIIESNFLRLALPISWGIRGSYVIQGLEQRQNYELFLASTLGTF